VYLHAYMQVFMRMHVLVLVVCVLMCMAYKWNMYAMDLLQGWLEPAVHCWQHFVSRAVKIRCLYLVRL